MAAPQISSQAREGFSNAKSYDAYRPSFPSKSVDTLLKAMKIYDFSYARVLEIGAGTGKFTSILAGRGEKFEVVAVEPHQEMRNVLEAKKLGGVKVVEGSATSMEAVEDGWADAVVIAQVRHPIAKRRQGGTKRLKIVADAKSIRLSIGVLSHILQKGGFSSARLKSEREC